MLRSLTIGVSMAASWSWGASLMVGLTVLTTMGIVPWTVWAFFNSITLATFGFAYYLLPKMRNATSFRPLRYVMGIIQIFSVWVNMQVIYEVAQLTGSIGKTGALVLALAAGAFFVLLVYRKGLEMSMFTDQFQYLIMYGGILTIIYLKANGGGDPNFEGVVSGSEAWRWAIFAAIAQLSGPFMDLQQWQRARVAVKEGLATPTFIIATLSFGLYMFLEFIAFNAGTTAVMGWALLVVASMVATSTLDSAAVALHEAIGGAGRGTLVGLAAVALWPLMASVGVVGLWSVYGTLRIAPAAAILLYGIGATYLSYRRREFARESA